MREIKFRAWCEADKMMYVNIETGINFGDGSFYDFRNFIDTPADDYHKWTLEQFTGLQDKNGVDIYEGDIVSVCPDDWTDPEMNKKSTFRVTRDLDFLGYAFGVEDISGYSCITHILEHSDDNETWLNAEIIGNIHENAEMIK